jgi:serine protease AprX
VKRRLAVTALSAMIVLAATSITIAAPSPHTPDLTGASATPIADLDGDKVFDNLEARVKASAPDDRLSVLVQLEKPLTDARFDALSAAVGGVELTGWLPIVRGFAATVTADQVRALAAKPGVAQVELNGIVHAYNNSAQLSFGVVKARADDPNLDGNVDNQPTYSPGDVVVAVIDSGIDAAHLELDDGKVLEFADCVDASCDTTVAPFDDNGHGTHVSGTIAGDGEAAFGLYRGVAPGAALVGVKVLDANGSGSDAGVISGIQWAVQNAATHGIEVLNVSLGANGCFNADEGMTSQAVNNAVAAGLRVFVAAGNAGPDFCTVGSPGVATSVVTVGAMADLGTGLVPGNRWRPGFGLAPFSSRGPTFDNQIKPDVVGPGVDITSAGAGTGNGFVALQGTSMATPFVAGVAALMLDHNPMLTPAAIKQILMNTAVDWGRGGIFHVPGTSGPDIDYGAGRLDAYKAIQAIDPNLTGPPAVPSHAANDGSLAATDAFAVHPVQVTTSGFPLSATLIMTQFSFGSPDFDLYLVAPDGTTVLSDSEFFTRQEEVGIVPINPGTYSLIVSSFEGGGPYILDISGGTPATPPPPPPQPPPQPPPAAPDTVAPIDPIIRSTGHRVGVRSRDRTVDVTWSGAADNLSGVDGFSYLWDRRPASLPDTVKDAEETATRTTSPALANGSWFFHLRTRDNAGNWTATRHLGPFVIAPPLRCVVPNVRGRTVRRARAALTRQRCRLGRVARAYSARVRRGRIVRQSRRPGARLARGTRVNVVVSRGKRR